MLCHLGDENSGKFGNSREFTKKFFTLDPVVRGVWGEGKSWAHLGSGGETAEDRILLPSILLILILLLTPTQQFIIFCHNRDAIKIMRARLLIGTCQTARLLIGSSKTARLFIGTSQTARLLIGTCQTARLLVGSSMTARLLMGSS